jgi:hypothetical protein
MPALNLDRTQSIQRGDGPWVDLQYLAINGLSVIPLSVVLQLPGTHCKLLNGLLLLQSRGGKCRPA